MKKRIANATPSLKRRTTTSLCVKNFVIRKRLPFIGVLNGVPDFEDNLQKLFSVPRQAFRITLDDWAIPGFDCFVVDR